MNLPYLGLSALLLTCWIVSWAGERSIVGRQPFWNMSYTWFGVGWIPGLLLLTLPIYRYPESLTLNDVLYIAGIHFCFVAGGLLALLSRKGANAREQGQPGRLGLITQQVLLAFLLLGIASQMLRIADAQLSGNIGLEQRFSVENLKDVKRQYMDQYATSSFLGPLMGANRWLAGLGQLGLLLYSTALANRVDWARRSLSLRFAAVGLSLAMIVAAWAVTGSRLGIALTALLAGAPWVLAAAARTGPARSRKPVVAWRWVVGGLAAGGAILFFSTVFQSGRIGQGADPLFILHEAHRATLEDDARAAASDNPALAGAALQASYFSTAIPTLLFYMHLPADKFPERQYGGMQFSLLSALLGRVVPGLEVKSAEDVYDAAAEPLAQAGYFIGPWPTLVRDAMIDFGRGGVFPFFFAFGFVASWLSAVCVTRPTLEGVAVLALLRVQMLFSAFHQLWSHPLFGYCFLLALTLAAASLMLRGRGAHRSTVLVNAARPVRRSAGGARRPWNASPGPRARSDPRP